MRKIVICAYNLRQGGAVQVGVSLVSLYLTSIALRDSIKLCLVSSAVYKNLDIGLQKDPLIVVLNNAPRFFLLRFAYDTYISLRYKKYVIFFIFGPCFSFDHSLPNRLALGFAEPWLLPNSIENIITKSFISIIRSRLYQIFKTQLFRCATFLWVETREAKLSLKSILNDRSISIEVIPNLPNQIFFNDEHPLKYSNCISYKYNIAIVGYPHVHKNLFSIFPAVKALNQIGFHFTLHLTIPFNSKHEKKMIKAANHYQVEGNICNHGCIPLSVCKSLYKECLISVHPSLMEISSVSPMEAALQGCELLLINLPFNKPRYNSSAYFYEPNASPNEIASIILEIYNAYLVNNLTRKSGALVLDLVSQRETWRLMHTELIHKLTFL